LTTNGHIKTDFSSEIAANKVQFEIHLATATAGTTPRVKYFQARGIEVPETLRVHDVTYLARESGFEDTKTLRDFLRGGRTATTLAKLADLNFHPSGVSGTENVDYVWVKMQGHPVEVPIYHAKDRMPEMGVRVRWREVSY
jgi:hypothetical protein